MEGVKWLFFDIGSTLVDETKVYDDIFHKIAIAANVSDEYVKTQAIEFYKQNKRGHKEVMRLLGVDYPEWTPEYEELYPDTIKCLRALEKKYKLGIIANQIPGAEKRLENKAIRQYFDLIVSSAEEGIAKVAYGLGKAVVDGEQVLRFSPAYPKHVLQTSTPDLALRDRIDNDIVPAKQMGMKTVRIMQGVGKYWNIQGDCETPDFEVNSLSELLNIF